MNSRKPIIICIIIVILSVIFISGQKRIKSGTITVSMPFPESGSEAEIQRTFEKLTDGFEQEYPGFGIELKIYADVSEIPADSDVYLNYRNENLEYADLSGFFRELNMEEYLTDFSGETVEIPLSFSIPALYYDMADMNLLQKFAGKDYLTKENLPEVMEDIRFEEFLANPEQPILYLTSGIVQAEQNPVSSGRVHMIPIKNSEEWEFCYGNFCAVNAESKNQKIAELWIEYLLSEEAQGILFAEHYGELPLHKQAFSRAVSQHQEFYSLKEVFEISEAEIILEENQILLPEVLYLSREEAVEKLTALGLRVIEKEKIHHSVIPEDYILTQNPSAGSVLEYGDSVAITLSDGWTEYVPDVLDMPKDKAAEKLETAGFKVKFREQSDEAVAPGSVTAQDMEPDSKVMLGSTITLTISTGREDINTSISETIDDYIGMNFEEVKALLSEKHLYALQIDTVYNPDIPNGTIIAQNIPAGSSVPQGTCIELKISLGQITVHVPECTGLHVDEARKLLEKSGLICMIIYTPTSDTPLDIVISQDKPADSSVAKGSQIWLTASVGSASQVISTGGWSGNPLPSFNTEPETEPETIEEIVDLYETAPEPEFEIIEPEIPEIVPEIPETEPIIETAPPEPEPEPETESEPDYEEAPEFAPV